MLNLFIIVTIIIITIIIVIVVISIVIIIIFILFVFYCLFLYYCHCLWANEDYYFSHVYATFWLGIELCSNRCRNLVPDESGAR